MLDICQISKMVPALQNRSADLVAEEDSAWSWLWGCLMRAILERPAQIIAVPYISLDSEKSHRWETSEAES